MQTKCGNVVLIGEANVGKSSIVNAIVGERVSIVADLAGTTRSAVRGVKTLNDYQIIFLDTPGMHKSINQLHKFSQKQISHALADADVIVYVLDDIKPDFIEKIKNYENFGCPVIVAVNKVDKTTMQKLYPKLEELNKIEFVKDIVPVSAKTGQNIDVLESKIVRFLPLTEFQFEKDEYTDQTTKSMAEEIIRAELLKHLGREIPHGLAVKISKWIPGRREIEIHADIICEKASHKPIIIGKRGSILKQVGMTARDEIRKLTGTHVLLWTHVFVRENWRTSNSKLKALGFEQH